MKSTWSVEEDRALFSIVHSVSEGPFIPGKAVKLTKTWVHIAQQFAAASVGRERTPKQCRERWANFLNPTIKKTAFSEDEEATVFRAWQDMGPAWVKIAELVPGRGDNAIKNCFNAGVRRFCRRLSKILKFSNLLPLFGMAPRETLDSKYVKKLI